MHNGSPNGLAGLKNKVVFCALSGLVLLASPAGAQVCHSVGSGQFFDGLDVCVETVLPGQAGNSYGPQNLLDPYDGKAWCEGDAGSGIGRTITLKIDRGAPFRTLLVSNGYPKSDRAYRNNNRIRTVRIETPDGLSVTRDLADTPDLVPVALPRADAHEWVKLEILRVYRGAKYDDTCLNFVGPDFEELERENSLAAETGPETAPAPVTADSLPAAQSPGGPATAIGHRMRLPQNYRDREQVKWLSQVMLAQAVFRNLAIADPAKAIELLGSRHVEEKWRELTADLWPDMDADVLWSMFLATSVSVSGNFSAERPVTAFYHPWSDLLLFLEWDKGALPDKGSIADVEIVPAALLRGGIEELEILPQWTFDGEASAEAVAMRTAQMAKLLETRFPPNGTWPWHSQLHVDSPAQWREVIKPVANLLSQLTAANADSLRAATDDVADSARALAIGITDMGKAGKLADGSGNLPFHVSQAVASLEAGRFGQYEPVAWTVDGKNGVMMLASVGGPPGCLSIRFSISGNGLQAVAVDAADYQPAYLYLVAGNGGNGR